MPPSDENQQEERTPGAVLSPPPPSRSSALPAGTPANDRQPGSGDRQPGSGPVARQRGRSRPAASQACQQRATASLFLAMLSLAGLLAMSNLARGAVIAGFAVLAGAVAAWFAATAIRQARRHGTAHPRGGVTALVIAAVGMAIGVLLLSGFAVLGTQLTTFSRCLTGANTVVAQQDCKSQFTHAVTARLGALRSPARG